MTGNADILFEVEGALGLITLNRPKALNALTLGMIRAMDAQLIKWATDPNIASVMVRGAGDKAFCAGGDVVALHQPGNEQLIVEFFRDEYRLNRTIFRYPKPYLALIDGFTMGGGVGVAILGRYRVATERTVFAMPETGIGMFPDVGGTYFLPRLPGELGMYLAMTGARLKGTGCVHAGLAEAVIASDRSEALVAGLAAGRHPDELLPELASADAEAALDEHRALIDKCFAADSVEAIMDCLAAEGGEWVEKTLATMRRMSPTAMKIAHRQLREGAKLDFEDCMILEYRLSQRVARGHDFPEGVRAVLVDKDMSPKWVPPTLAEVSDEEIDGVFAPLPDGDLTFPA
ncbi:MAG: enoyl-CoA hydratase/isomerase family protein [Alphaproteobacteria bacterium]|nr:enoyl-CoA hydratase/isomerase family protein [Alphaproteobacteria bacterium]